MALLIIPRAYLITYEGEFSDPCRALKVRDIRYYHRLLIGLYLTPQSEIITVSKGIQTTFWIFLQERICITEREPPPAGENTSPIIACDIQWSEIQGRGDCSLKAHKCRAFLLRRPILGRERTKRVRIYIFRRKAVVLTMWQTMSSLMSTTGTSA